jgi:2-polyprenyl-3-methyl-5-hydroxy-6-metoxy-1,4-benzoquinol methylase
MVYPIKVIPNPRPLMYSKKVLDKGGYTNNQILNIINKLHPDKALRILDISNSGESLASYLKNSRSKKQLDDEILIMGSDEPLEPLQFSYYQFNVNNKDQFEQVINEYRGYFDIILGIGSIEYTENPKLYLYQLQEMLNDEGNLFISMTDITNPTSRRTFYKTGRIEQFCEKGMSKNLILPNVLYVWAAASNLDIMIEYPLGLYPKLWVYPSKKALYVTICNLKLFRLRGSLSRLYIFKRST